MMPSKLLHSRPLLLQIVGAILALAVSAVPELVWGEAAPTSTSGPASCRAMDSNAVGDGRADDTGAIQSAIDHCPRGGVVILEAGHRFLSGTIRLKSDLTFRIEPGARLLGSRRDADYPDLTPPTQNSQLKQCRKALLYAEGVKNLVIEGEVPDALAGDERKSNDSWTSYRIGDANFSSGLSNQPAALTDGIIDGSGDNHPGWEGPEATRPMAIFIALSSHVVIRHLQVLNSGMWSVVHLESDDLLLDSLHVDSRWGPTRDGLDLVDCSHVLIQNCDIYSEDDSICLKSGGPKGVHDIVVRDSLIHNSLVANAMKLGTASTGVFENILFENIDVEATRQSVMAVESVDGSVIHNVRFKNIKFDQAGLAFFVLLGQRKGSLNLGSIDDVQFEDIQGRTKLNWGSVVSGIPSHTNVAAPPDSVAYKVTNLHFKNITLVSDEALHSQPSTPPEYGGEYPDPRMWGPMPAFGIFLRHASGISLENTHFIGAAGDVRPAIVRDDASLK